jgi:hypothetical protein
MSAFGVVEWIDLMIDSMDEVALVGVGRLGGSPHESQLLL